MTTIKNYYITLGLTNSCTTEQIKKAYRNLAFRYHPDVCKEPNAQHKFIEITEAYEILSDYKQRIIYDELIKNSNNYRNLDQFENYRKTAHSKAHNFSNLDFEIFKSSVLDKLHEVAKTTNKLINHGCGGLLFLIPGMYWNIWFINYWVNVIIGEIPFAGFKIFGLMFSLFITWVGYITFKELFKN